MLSQKVVQCPTDMSVDGIQWLLGPTNTSKCCNFFAGNGYIEGSELDSFLREFVSSVNNADSGPEVKTEK